MEARKPIGKSINEDVRTKEANHRREITEKLSVGGQSKEVKTNLHVKVLFVTKEYVLGCFMVEN